MFSDLAKGKRNWQLAAFGSIGIAAVLALGLVSLATESRIMPYVIEVDQLGRARAFGPPDRLRSPDQRLIASQLAAFVRDIRSVTTDATAQAELVRQSYAFVDQSAADFLNAYFANPTNDPRVLAHDGSRLVEVVSVLPLPSASDRAAPTNAGGAGSATWKISWTETTYPRGTGGGTTTSAWEGYFATRVVPPRTTERIELNPLGLFVTAINWTRLATRPNAVATAPLTAVSTASAASVPTTTAPNAATPDSATAAKPAPISHAP